MSLPRLDPDVVKRQVNALTIYSQHVQLHRAGRNHVGRCPFHDDKTPSFNVFDDGGFKCFGCGECGDLIAFVQLVNGCTFVEAMQELAGTPHLAAVPRSPPVDDAEQQRHQAQRHAAAEKAWHSIAVDEALTARWMQESRGLYPLPDVTRHVRVAHIWNATDALALLGPHARCAVLEAAHVLVLPMRHPVTGCLGNLHLRGLGGISQPGPKGWNLVDTRLTGLDGAPLFYGQNVELCRYARTLFLVEGGPDTIALQSVLPAGDVLDHVVVGVHSAGAMAPAARWLRDNAPAPRVVILPHLDAPTADGGPGTGVRAAIEAAQILGPRCRIASWWTTAPHGGAGSFSDVADAVRAGRALGLTCQHVLAGVVGVTTP